MADDDAILVKEYRCLIQHKHSFSERFVQHLAEDICDIIRISDWMAPYLEEALRILSTMKKRTNTLPCIFSYMPAQQFYIFALGRTERSRLVSPVGMLNDDVLGIIHEYVLGK